MGHEQLEGLPPGDAYGLLFDRVDNMVCTLDLEGRFTSLNRAGEQLTGYRADEVAGMLAVELIAPELRAEAVRQFQARLESGDETGDETMLVTKDGRRIPIEITSTLFLADGRPAGVLGLVRDLSELKRAEEALRQSEQRIRSSFESAPIGMAIVAPDGRFLEVNESLCEILGYSSTELVAKTFQEITHPDDLELDLGYVRQMLAGEIRTYEMEKRYFDCRGEIVLVLLSVSLVRSADGTPLYFISQIQDITEQKRNHEALELSKARLAEAQQIAQVGSWERDYATGAISWSDELYRIYGLDPASTELNFDGLSGTVHPDDFAECLQALKRSQHGEPIDVEHRIVRPDGRIRWAHARGQAVMGEDGPVVVRGTVQDVTERKEAEQRYRTLVEQLPLGTYVRPLDITKPNIYASPQVEPLLGYAASEWESNPELLATIIHPEDRERVLAGGERLRKTGTPLREEYRYIARDGRIVWVQDETYVVCDDRGEPAFVQGFLLDITERKLAEAERDRLREDLHHAQKLEAIGRLAGGVAHDFNNMLTAINGYSELLLGALDPADPTHEHASQIKRAADQASKLPKQLLAFSRKQTLEPKLVDLNDVVSSSGDLLRHVVTERIAVDTDCTARAANAHVDPSQIEHVLVNLALNARDAMPDGGTLSLSTANVEVAAETAVEHDVDPGSYVVISVADTGHGMDADTKARAFEPFFTTRVQGQGYGLGLASVYGTVTQSGGFIELESEPGRGTTFAIHFPCVKQAAAVHATGAGASVLIAEDEELVRDLATRVLELAGLEVHAASNGEEALELYTRIGDSVDVVLTDMVMPGVGGRELAKNLRAADPDLPIVFMSGYTEEKPLTREGEAPPPFLPKPFSAEDLTSVVRGLIDERSQIADDRNRSDPRAGPVVSGDQKLLTRREAEILRLVADGMTNDKVAAELAISPETVQSHVRNSMAKLDADSRTQAVAKALRQSLIA